MANKMIIDASHPEETRVVVLRGNRVEEFDFEAASKKPLRGNIYLAKVARVEPSLQAAFVDYGGNRHGFLAFSEMHPDYYQIPVADRQALLEEEARAHLDDEDEPNGEHRSRRRRHPRQQGQTLRADDGETISAPAEAEEAAERDFGPLAAPESVWVEPAVEQDNEPPEAVIEARADVEPAPPADEAPATDFEPAVAAPLDSAAVDAGESFEAPPPMTAPDSVAPIGSEPVDVEFQDAEPYETEAAAEPFEDADEYVEPAYDRIEAIEPAAEDDDEPEVTTLGGAGSEETEMRAPRPRSDDEGEPVEVVGGDAMDETPRRAPRLRRTYKIQEVIKRRQVLLVQVVKEERGNKGAALTTYLSLAGRY